MLFKPQEYCYLSRLTKWEKTAPLDGRMGSLDGADVENSQTARMARLLQLVVGTDATTYQKLAKWTQRRNGKFKVSADKSQLRAPYEIVSGWYFEGNMSLKEKHAIIEDLPSLGIISIAFVPCAQDFVAAKSVEKYWPDTDETRNLFQKWLGDERYWPDAHSEPLCQQLGLPGNDELRSQMQKWLDDNAAARSA
jgi:hypothetical protein